MELKELFYDMFLLSIHIYYLILILYFLFQLFLLCNFHLDDYFFENLYFRLLELKNIYVEYN